MMLHFVLLYALVFFLVGRLLFVEWKVRVLQRETTTDALTGVSNRRGFDRVIDGKEDTEVSVILIDIDRFKEINDRYGHHAGDVVLQQVAQAIRSNVAKGDFVARVGGDEFAVLLPNTTAQEAAVVCKRLRDVMSQLSIQLGSDLVQVSICAGYEHGSLSNHGQDLLGRADTRMYYQKLRR